MKDDLICKQANCVYYHEDNEECIIKCDDNNAKCMWLLSLTLLMKSDDEFRRGGDDNRRKMTDIELKRREAICEVAGIKDIGELSDGFHTFNSLYEQRMILFAALVKAYRDKAWKSYKHEDGEYCFGGGWFIVGIDTPKGSYTYHYENKYWDMFDCIDLPRAKHWDGHTEANAKTRLMSLPERKINEDAISRAAAIDEFYKATGDGDKADWAVGVIRCLPSAQPEQQWNPCSERLPKPNKFENNVRKYYLVQNEYGDMMVCSWHGSFWMQMYHNTHVEDKVVAWRELPDPWEGEKDE